jgi:uncharacterized protein (TIGR00251 family)
MRLKVKAQANASSNEIVGLMGDELKIRVSAAPESGKANRAIEALLADRLGLKKQDVCISSGFSSVHKTVEIGGINEAVLKQKLNL